jgi:NAD(P)H:quinone oxidoreductase type IV
MVTTVRIIFYSMYGHIHRMAEAAADGAGQVAGVTAELYQVPELVPEAALQQRGAAKARVAFAHIPIASVDHLAGADAIMIGTPTRFGNMCAQMRNFLDQTGGLWVKGALAGKVGSVFHQHGDSARRARNHDCQRSLDAPASRYEYRGCAILRA